MFARLLAPLLLAAAAGPLAAADAPTFTAQAQPAARWLGDLRTFVAAFARPQGGSDKAVEGFDRGLKDTLGEKGFDGLDLDLPLAAYGTVPEDPTKTVVVFVLPVTNEIDFLALLDRLKWKAAAVAGQKGLYAVTPSGYRPPPAALRFAHGHAYLAVNDTGPALDPAALIPPETLAKPGEKAHLAVRFAPDRLPAKLLKGLFEKYTEIRKQAFAGRGGPGGRPNLSFGMMELLLIDPWLMLAGRNLDALTTEAQDITLRVTAVPDAGDVAAEVTVTPKPGTPLAAAIAARKPTANTFAGVIPAGPAAGLTLGLAPVGDRVAELAGLLETAKDDAGPLLRPVLGELLTALTRTAKGDALDLAAGLSAPDDKGRVHAVGAVTLDDPSKLEAAVKEMVKGLPAEVKKAVTLDAGKAGAVTLHTLAVADLLPKGPDTSTALAKLFGPDVSLCVGFGPKAVYAAMGSDPVAAVKAAADARPGPAKALDFYVTRAAVRAVVAKLQGEKEAGMVDALLGPTPGPRSVLAVAVEGGADLKVRLAVNPVMAPRGSSSSTQTFERVGPVPRVK